MRHDDTPLGDILMFNSYHHDVRTTLTLDEDVAARLQSEARRTGKPFKLIVNEHLRASLAQRRAVRMAPPFVVKPFDLGGRIAAHSYDDIGGLLDEIEGPLRR